MLGAQICLLTRTFTTDGREKRAMAEDQTVDSVGPYEDRAYLSRRVSTQNIAFTSRYRIYLCTQ